MKVLKFGGTSVGSAININRVISILDSIPKTSNCIVVLSAFGGITDKLIAVANKAVNKDETYKASFESIKKHHFVIIDELIKEDSKNEHVKNIVLEKLTNLEQLLDGLYFINELSPKTTDKLLSFGELLSSFVISETMKSRGLDVILKNAQDLIITDNNHTNALVFQEETENKIKDYFKNNTAKTTIVPGFVSKSIDDELTNLGRGG